MIPATAAALDDQDSVSFVFYVILRVGILLCCDLIMNIYFCYNQKRLTEEMLEIYKQKANSKKSKQKDESKEQERGALMNMDENLRTNSVKLPNEKLPQPPMVMVDLWTMVKANIGESAKMRQTEEGNMEDDISSSSSDRRMMEKLGRQITHNPDHVKDDYDMHSEHSDCMDDLRFLGRLLLVRVSGSMAIKTFIFGLSEIPSTLCIFD